MSVSLIAEAKASHSPHGPITAVNFEVVHVSLWRKAAIESGIVVFGFVLPYFFFA